MNAVSRRGFVTGLAALVAGPAVLRVARVMPISARNVPAFVVPNFDIGNMRTYADWAAGMLDLSDQMQVLPEYLLPSQEAAVRAAAEKAIWYRRPIGIRSDFNISLDRLRAGYFAINECGPGHISIDDDCCDRQSMAIGTPLITMSSRYSGVM